VLDTADGPWASVALEGPVRTALGRSVAAVGIGPPGAQVVCLVVDGPDGLTVAAADVRSAVRRAASVPVAAVLVGRLPVDRRHESKIDQAAVAVTAAQFLAGR
jgi:hypothetical protein